MIKKNKKKQANWKKKFFRQPYHNILSIWLVILLCVEGSSNSVLYSCPKSGTHSHLQCAPPSLLQCWPQVLLPSSFSSTCRHHCQAYNSNQYHSLFQKRVHWIECSWLPAGESSKMKKKNQIVKPNWRTLSWMCFCNQFSPNNKRAALTDDEALSQIKKGHDTMCVMLSSRLKNLETVRAVWIREDVKVRRKKGWNFKLLCVLYFWWVVIHTIIHTYFY